MLLIYAAKELRHVLNFGIHWTGRDGVQHNWQSLVQQHMHRAPGVAAPVFTERGSCHKVWVVGLGAAATVTSATDDSVTAASIGSIL